MKLVLPLVISIFSFSPLFAQYSKLSDDNAGLPESYYKEGLFLNNLQYGSANPSYIKNVPYRKLNDITVSFNQEKGSFKPIDGANKSNATVADIYGIKKMEKTFFQGSIKYQYNNQNDMRWNGTVMTTPANPFILTDTLRYDSLTNDADRESFILNGGVAYQVTDRITVGLSTNYSVATKADQSDPRLQSNAARTIVLPGIDISLGARYSLGLSGLVEIYHEDIESSVQDNLITEHNNVYILKALGIHEGKDGLGYKRRYDGKLFGASMQSSYTGKEIKDYTEISFNMNKENALDGGTSYQYHGGDFSQTTIKLNNRLHFVTNSLVHNLSLSAKMESSKGLWYNQKQIKDNWGQKNYQVLSQEIIHKESNLSAGISYRIDKTRNGLTNFSTIINAGFSNVSVNQYPEENHADYSKINAGMEMKKRFHISSDILEVHVSGSYEKAINPLDISVATPKPADKRFYRGYFLPKYEYLASDSYGAGLGFSYYNSSLMDNCTIRISGNGSFRGYLGDYPAFCDGNRVYSDISVGLIF